LSCKVVQQNPNFHRYGADECQQRKVFYLSSNSSFVKAKSS
jgi:hypothetical protein